MVLAAIEQNEPPQRRLVTDDLAASFLPPSLQAFVRATRFTPVREAVIGASERSGPGLWASIAGRKRFIDERLSDPLNEFDTAVVLGAGLDIREGGDNLPQPVYDGGSCIGWLMPLSGWRDGPWAPSLATGPWAPSLATASQIEKIAGALPVVENRHPWETAADLLRWEANRAAARGGVAT